MVFVQNNWIGLEDGMYEYIFLIVRVFCYHLPGGSEKYVRSILKTSLQTVLPFEVIVVTG